MRGKGQTVTDIGIGDNDCDLVGDLMWVAGKVGTYALDFVGDGDYIKTADITNDLDFAPNSFSVSAWINAREVTEGGRTILEYNRAGDNWFGIWLSGECRFHFRVGASTKNSNQELNANEWYLLTDTFDSAIKDMCIYINGQFDSSSSQSIGFSSPAASKLTIGVVGQEDAEYYDGKIDDIRIYDVALSMRQVKALFDGY